MSTFKNVSGEDRDVQIDGNRIHVPAGDTFTVADVHDDSLIDQPHFELAKTKKPAPEIVTPAEADPTEGEI